MNNDSANLHLCLPALQRNGILCQWLSPAVMAQFPSWPSLSKVKNRIFSAKYNWVLPLPSLAIFIPPQTSLLQAIFSSPDTPPRTCPFLTVSHSRLWIFFVWLHDSHLSYLTQGTSFQDLFCSFNFISPPLPLPSLALSSHSLFQPLLVFISSLYFQP